MDSLNSEDTGISYGAMAALQNMKAEQSVLYLTGGLLREDHMTRHVSVDILHNIAYANAGGRFNWGLFMWALPLLDEMATADPCQECKYLAAAALKIILDRTP